MNVHSLNAHSINCVCQWRWAKETCSQAELVDVLTSEA